MIFMYKWNDEKNILLKATRNVGFTEILQAMQDNGVIDTYKHPNSAKYPNQYIYVVEFNDYIYFVPFVYENENIFLKNIIPSRKLNKKYKGK
jgi:uncharacterized DUF497 family protein